MSKSEELKAEEAVEQIHQLETAEDVQAYAEGDERKTVVKAAGERIADLSSPEEAEKEEPLDEEKALEEIADAIELQMNKYRQLRGMTSVKSGIEKKLENAQELLTKLRG